MSSPRESSSRSKRRRSTGSAVSSARVSSSPGRCRRARCSSTSRTTRRTQAPPRPMQHSHEALDRPGGLATGGLIAPLRHIDFRILWAGMAVSLLGDGIFLIAVAWESYALWNTPAALSIVGIGMTVPTVVFLLIGGVLSDRHDRRLLMLGADVLRAGAVACLAVLVFAGALRLWELVALVA